LNEVYKAAPNSVHSGDAAAVKVSVFPNPATDHLTFDYYVPNEGHSQLTLFNTLGEKIATIVDKNESAGIHAAYFDASELASGTYIYVLQTSGGVVNGKVSVQ
jgi:serine protease AprX